MEKESAGKWQIFEDDADSIVATFMSSGNVGIGTDSPTEKLSVSGNIELDDMPANGTRYLMTNETNTGTGRINIQAGGGSAAYGGGLSLIANSHASKPGWVIAGISSGAGSGATEGRFVVNTHGLGTGTDIFTVLRTGNVGIGTTTPNFKTHIRGGSGTEETVLKIDKSSAADSGGHTTIVGLGCESAGWAKAGIAFERTGAYDTGKMHFLMYPAGLNTNTVGLSNSVMTINNDSNVGIGTTNPDNILHIETSNSGGPQIQLESTSGTASAAFINFDSTSLQLSTQRDMVDGGWYDTSKSWGGISIQGPAGGSFITFHTAAASNTSPTERMRITSGGDITISGGDIFLNSGTNYNDKGVVYLSNERTAIISDIVDGTANGDTSLDFQTRKGGTRASAMFINEFRNVMIGTTTQAPSAQLTIALEDSVGGRLSLSNLRTALFDGDEFGRLSFVSNDATQTGDRARISAVCRDTGAATDLVFYTGNTSASVADRMRITSGGLLFVNDTTDNYGYTAHHITNDASQGYALIVRNSNTSTENNSVIQLNQATTGTSGYFMICRQGDPNSGTNRLFIYSNGNVQNTNNSYGVNF